MTTYNIQTSEVAALIGWNQYNSIEESYLKFIKRHDKELFKAVLKELNVVPIDIEATNALQENNVLSIWFYKSLKAKDHETLQKCFTTMEKVADKLEHPKRKEIYDELKSRISMRRGNKFEEAGIKKYETKFNKKVTDRNSFLYEKVMKKTPDYTIIMKAKIDGIDQENNCLIEHKNRVRKIKDEIPEHEKVQLEIYMHLTKLSECKHVQTCFDETLVLPYTPDIKKWKEIKVRLCKSMDNIHILLNNKKKLKKVC